MKTNDKKIKEMSMLVRQKEVESNHIRGKSAEEIAKILKVSIRTVERDIQEIRQRNLLMFKTDSNAREWIVEQLADTLMSIKEIERKFWSFSETSTNESVRLRSTWFIVQTLQLKKDTFASLGLIYDNLQKNKTTLFKQEVSENKSPWEFWYSFLNPKEMLEFNKTIFAAMTRAPDYPHKEEMLEKISITIQQFEAIERIKKREEEFEYKYPNPDESIEDFEKRKAEHEASKKNIEKEVD